MRGFPVFTGFRLASTKPMNVYECQQYSSITKQAQADLILQIRKLCFPIPRRSLRNRHRCPRDVRAQIDGWTVNLFLSVLNRQANNLR